MKEGIDCRELRTDNPQVPPPLGSAPPRSLCPCQPGNEGNPAQPGFKQRLMAQFGRPVGFWGWLVGWVMTFSNRERTAWTVSLLDIQRQDRVLEIGFGPGMAIQRISRLAPAGHIAGIDHSKVMLQQARKRNARAIAQGQVDLRLGSVTELPAFAEPFDKIFSINSIQFWPEPVQRLSKLFKALKPGGQIAITLQPRHPGATDNDSIEAGQWIARQLGEVGFVQIRTEIKPIRPRAAVCVLGVKPK